MKTSTRQRRAIPRTSKGFSSFRSGNAGETVYFFDQLDSRNRPYTGLCEAEFESDTPGTLVKRALLMVEGKHVDSKKRKHFFPAERIKRIAQNTNKFLTQFGRVPWQKDHQKTQDSNIGDLEGPVKVEVITEDNLPHPDLSHLIGRLGIFTDRLVAKGQDVIDQITAGRIKTLSPGIDTETDIIREVSATPTPAIVGLMTFKRHDPTARFTSLTMEQAEVEMADMEALNQEAHDLLDLFLKVNEAILNATEDELEGQDPYELQVQAVEDFTVRLSDLIGLNDEEPGAEEDSGELPLGSTGKIPSYAERMQGIDMSNGLVLAAFSMSDMEKMLGLAEFRRTRRDKGRKRGRRKKVSIRDRLIGQTATGRIARGVGAAALVGGAGLAAARMRKGANGGVPNFNEELELKNDRTPMRYRMRNKKLANQSTSPPKGLPSKRGTKGPNSSYRKSKRSK